MFDDKVILCGSSSYEKIFYFNPEFDSLPKQIKEELQIMFFLQKMWEEFSDWNLMKQEILILMWSQRKMISSLTK